MGSSDVAVAPLPIEAMPANHFVLPIPRSAFQDRTPVMHFGDAPVKMYGRAMVGRTQSLVIVREGLLCTPERPTATVEIAGRDVTLRPYIVDGLATPGMGGGPVIVSTGAGSAQNTIIGITRGYAYVARRRRVIYADSDLQSVNANLMDEIDAVSNRIVHVVPSEDVYELL